MDEKTFIKEKKENWEKLSALVTKLDKKGIKSLGKEEILQLGRLYQKASADLAYAKTHIQREEVIIYLNQLVAKTHSYIYTTSSFDLSQAVHFFRNEFPRLFRVNLKFIGLAFLIFLSTGLVLYFLTLANPKVVYSTLPPVFLEGMEKMQSQQRGEIFPKTLRPVISSQIMVNNIQVGFMAFASGILFGIGTIYVTMSNAILLGSLSAVFTLYNHDLAFWALILPHGIMELAAIFICAGAGLVLGYSLINPAQLSRKESLVLKGKEAVKLVVGSLPLFVVAALIEGFITPLSIPDYGKLVVAFLTIIPLYLYLFPSTKTKADKEEFS